MGVVQRLADTAGLTEERLNALLTECGPGDGTWLGAAMRHALFTRSKRSGHSWCSKARSCSASRQRKR
jgi:hypothetical protein